MSEITVLRTGEDSASRSLQVTVPVERVREAESRAVRQYAQRARLPGFRPGKAPEGVVRRRFSSEIRQWVIEEIIREGWEQARTSEDLKPIADPSIRNLKFEEGKPVEFELVVEVKPQIVLTRTGGFSISRQLGAITADQVQEQVDRLREQKAAWLPVEGEKPSPGNRVRGEVATLEGGEAKPAQPFSMVIGQGEAVPDLEEKILTMLPGQIMDAEIKVPEDHPDESRRGQTRHIRLTLHDVKRQELPPLEDAFAKEVGDFETLDALRSAVRDDLQREAERSADARVREALVQQLVEANGVEAPPSLVDRVLHAFEHSYEVPAEQHEAFASQFRPIAVAQVRRDLVLSAVAEANNLAATEADLDARITQIAAAKNVPPAQVYSSLQQAKRLAEVERAITEEKVFAHLLSQSTVHEVTP